MEFTGANTAAISNTESLGTDGRRALAWELETVDVDVDLVCGCCRCCRPATADSPGGRIAVAVRGQAAISRGLLNDDVVVQQYRRSSPTAIPSIALEGFGLIALESLAVGRAPIVTACGGLPNAVRTLDASLVVARNDADALAERLASALSGDRPSPERYRHHAETFTWSAAARHVELYARL